MSVPLIEGESGASNTSSGTATDSGPSLSVQTGGGVEVVLDSEDLLVLLALVQTLMMAYVTYRGVQR
ncbi:hypothetical protein [Haloarchaeobius sp. HRN-SO-5]|uniref:hypothetical protein n=1 Tax=Haloarchaeobius sp. HRN-SO-5 TaxID=3446118 RepID=UPI003EB8F196